MDIRILEFIEGAQAAEGMVVIIDVFRAFSVACYAFDQGASAIIATAEAEEALKLKSFYTDAILAGERNERNIPGFDLGNSPTDILKTNLTGKILIHTTTAGTNGLVNVKNSNSLITGSLVNVNAIIRYIKKLNPQVVSLVAMGYRATISAEEDLLCAEIIADGLNGKNYVYQHKISDLQYSSGSRFFKAENLDFSPPSDFFLCTMLNRFDFVLEAVKRSDGNVSLNKIPV